MSPKTKGRVVYGRKVQLALRVLALAGAIGSLFCSIVIKNAAVTVIWIVRVGVSDAIRLCYVETAFNTLQASCRNFAHSLRHIYFESLFYYKASRIAG